MPTWRLKIFITLLGVLSIPFLLVMAGNIYFKERVPWGVYLADTYLGGKSYLEVNTFLEKKSTQLNKEPVKIYTAAGESPLVFSLEELGITLAKEKLLQEVMDLKLSFNLIEMYRLITHGIHLPGHFNCEEEKLIKTLVPVQAGKYVPPQNATIRAEGGKLRITPSQKGRRLKIGDFGEKILQKLSCWPSFPLTIYTETEWLFPEKTILQILQMGIKEEIASTSTFFNPGDQNRAHNIVLAAKKLDNVILAPGELFSFNRIVGEATLEAGYKEAPVIVQERVVLGPGGGICQVSSTLYHAALLAGASIEERHNHGLPVGYLPLGYDATIAYNFLDLKFRNNKPFYILIHLQVLENSIKVTFFGSPSPAEKIKIVTQSIQKINPPVKYQQIKDKPISHYKILQEGKPGFIVETVRIFYEHDQESNREYLGKDHYAPTPQIIAVGTLLERKSKAEDKED